MAGEGEATAGGWDVAAAAKRLLQQQHDRAVRMPSAKALEECGDIARPERRVPADDRETVDTAPVKVDGSRRDDRWADRRPPPRKGEPVTRLGRGDPGDAERGVGIFTNRRHDPVAARASAGNDKADEDADLTEARMEKAKAVDQNVGVPLENFTVTRSFGRSERDSMRKQVDRRRVAR